MLKELVDQGDPIAKNSFKEEVTSRFKSLNGNVQKYLLRNGYLNYFSKNEKDFLYKFVVDKKVWLDLTSTIIENEGTECNCLCP